MKGPSVVARTIGLCVLSLVLVFADYRTGVLTPLRSTLSAVAVPFYWLVDTPERFVNWSADTLINRRDLLADNEALRSEAIVLRAKMQRLSVLEAENSRLRELLNSSEIVSDDVLVAELIGVSPDPAIHTIVLNRGSSDGVYVGQAVLDAHGLMGQVTAISSSSSRVLLITDATHAMPVQINRNGVRAILEGVGRLDQLELRHVPATMDIQVGDILVSSGLGRRFPVGYPVATIVSVSRDPGQAFAMIKASPSAHLDRSRHVLLVFDSIVRSHDAEL